MLHKQQRRIGSSSLLELEAAEYFKLDIRQMDLSHSRSQDSNIHVRRDHSSSSSSESFTDTNRSAAAMTTKASRTSVVGAVQDRPQCSDGGGGGPCQPNHRCNDQGRHHCYKQQQLQRPKHQTTVSSTPKSKAAGSHSEKATQTRESTSNNNHTVDRALMGCKNQKLGQLDQRSSSDTRNDTRRLACGAYHHRQEQAPTIVVGSSTSTNSLPSITSSPSVSPSLVCPHLSLDDILDNRQDSSGSPHTIGLCPKCRLDPPPNIHSPLSPQFRPHSRASFGSPSRTQSSLDTSKRVRRGYSDHHASYCSIRRIQQQPAAADQKAPMVARHQSDLSKLRDDSLDCCLEPSELKRMQLSPTMRNSVEFIRRNSTESGRVVRIYKNGEPFEKPLRVCILRGEFSTLTHLLDHINSRLLVPLGARYLFHLDGQLVYSVHELKHESAYVVSGTRAFNYRTSEVLKDQRKREQANRLSQEHRALIRQQLEGSNQQMASGATTDVPSNRRQVAASRLAADRVGRTEQARAKASGPKWTEQKHEVQLASEPVKENNHRAVRRVHKPVSTPNGIERSPCDGKTSRLQAGRQMPPADQRRTQQGPNMAFRSIEPQASKARKFSRYDDTAGMAPSGPAANDQTMSLIDNERPIRLMRAKSEMSALPTNKQKKNVTFKDTGRGSSPAISDLSSSGGDTITSTTRRTVSTEQADEEEDEPPEQTKLKKELNTSEVGIQVSDSIDGFLIDLPVALPARGDDSSLADPLLRRPRLGSRPTKGANKATIGVKQIVTITERQLSHEEMTELADLSHGDHHDHHEVIIKWGPPEQVQKIQTATTSAPHLEPIEAEIVPDRSNTITIGSNPQEKESVVGNGRLVASVVVGHPEMASTGVDDGQWQYPSGDGASSTPAERPVSQIGPNESVRARVTTPTPSLSTGGDNNSLTLSYETTTLPTVAADGSIQETRKPGAGCHSELPAKQRAQVMGTLCDGLDAPTRNFRLVWVNGFSINDIYPDNSVDVQRLAGSAVGTSRAKSSGLGDAARLSPSQRPQNRQRPNQPAAEFKPSERYHNWICHSREHDELVYPAGALIVLWCRWNNEQRYYARHTSNVTCLTLATPNSDLAASAQSRDPFERRQIGSLIHLWSLSSLALLHVIDDDQFRWKMIFSMRLKSNKTLGCELSVAARDERQLSLLEFSGKLAGNSQDKEISGGGDKGSPPSERKGSIKGTIADGNQQYLIMRTSKVLQSNQLPLFVLRLPRHDTLSRPGEPSGVASRQQQTEPLISFGRRHFNMWAADVKQRKLRPMQADQKSAKFTELVARANCLCRISPDEFLLGDSDGNVTLLLITCGSNLATGRGPTGGKQRASPLDSADSRYSIEIIELLGPSSSSSAKPAEDQAGRSDTHSSISCLTRISGSLFISADNTCTLRFWKIKRKSSSTADRSTGPSNSSGDQPMSHISCEQLSSISLPPDLGFICSIILSQYNLKESIVEFYVVSTSNSILFGSVKLPQQLAIRRSTARHHQTADQGQQEQQPADLLANSSLSVVYEGHEISASGLVADSGARETQGEERAGLLYFTCSLDCRICKWDGKQLIWKSMLPSSCVSLAVHPLGPVLAVGSVDGTVYILDKTSGLLISYFPLTPVCINCLAYSSDGSLLAAGCANGSIFMLPVYERGLKYRKVSIFQSPNAVVSLQFSLDNRYMLTSVSHGSYQELILWDLPNFRYMRDNVKLAADKIQWFDSICSGSEDVRAIWENAHLSDQAQTLSAAGRQAPKHRPTGAATTSPRNKSDQFVVNLSCHRLIRGDTREGNACSPEKESFVIASDTRGYLRLFRYPAYDIQQGFYAVRICSSAVNCCRFLEPSAGGDGDHFVSTSLDGSICLWTLE